MAGDRFELFQATRRYLNFLFDLQDLYFHRSILNIKLIIKIY